MARSSWLDDQTNEVKIDDYARQLNTFLEALADGRVDAAELAASEQRVADAIRQVEPQLDDEMHAKVTTLLCELSAYNIMQFAHELEQARTTTTFRG